VLDSEADVGVVRPVVVEAVVCAGDEMIDESEDVISPAFDVTELRAAADVSLPSNSLSTSCALMSVMTKSKESNIREALVRASILSKGVTADTSSGIVSRRIRRL